MRIIRALILVQMLAAPKLFGQCDSSYTYQDTLPSSLTIILGDSCFFDDDIAVLDSLVSQNSLVYVSGLELGTQTWSNGRLKILVAGNYGNSSGVNDTIFTLPENIGNWSEMTSLYLEWNRISNLPESFSNLVNLRSLYLSNNVLDSINSDFGNISDLYFLDLGYNHLETIPASVCSLESLTYMWIFNNKISEVPSCICSLNLDWDGTDNAFYPYAAFGGNELCEDVPSCVENSAHFHTSLDQFYYSFMVTDSQRCGTMSADVSEFIPSQFSLSNPYPNPFNPETRFTLKMNRTGLASISILNILGQKIDVVLPARLLRTGSHKFHWNAENFHSGIYFIKAVSAEQEVYRKIVFSK